MKVRADPGEPPGSEDSVELREAQVVADAQTQLDAAGGARQHDLLARLLDAPFYDSDAEIERRTGVDIPFIFEKEGEAGFRQRERETLEALTVTEPMVLATGGGAVLLPENRVYLATRGFVARVFALEYAILGVAAGLCGSLLAVALAWSVGHWALDIGWAGSPVTIAGGVVGAALLAIGVGFLGTFRLLGRKPLGVLRGE